MVGYGLATEESGFDEGQGALRFEKPRASFNFYTS
jgi:hypothetical protein